MKILINGNMGYIGPVVARHLRRTHPNSVLVGCDTGYFAGCQLEHFGCADRAIDVQYLADVREPSDSTYAGVDSVIQLAAISNDPMGNAFEHVTGDVNTKAVIAAAKVAKRNGAISFVFASSCSVYGAGGDDAKTEDSPLNPLTAYARSKIAAEDELRALADDAFTITCLRFATACGFSPRLRLDLVLNDFVAGALTNGEIAILSDGTPWRPLIHVRDMARAIEWAISREKHNGGSYLVVNAGANDWNFRVRELADAVSTACPNVKVSVNPNAAPDKRSYRVDFGRFRSLAPGHQPLETLEATIRELVSELRRISFNDVNYRSSKLIRLNVLSHLRQSGEVSKDLYWKTKLK